MADSQREVLLEAIAAALDKAGKPEGFTVHRHRLRPLEQDLLPAGVIFNGIETVGRQTLAPPIMERELVFRVEVRGEGEPADEVLDPYVTWVESTLMTDSSIRCLVLDLELRQIIWDQRNSRRARAAAALEFAAKYRTTYGDPTTAAP